jgi:amphi-Trp domain-containing protein
MEETVFEVEKKMSNAEISDYLKNVAEKVEKSRTIKLESDGQKVELDTDRNTEFEIKVEREEGEESLELEIEWKEKAPDLSIE